MCGGLAGSISGGSPLKLVTEFYETLNEGSRDSAAWRTYLLIQREDTLALSSKGVRMPFAALFLFGCSQFVDAGNGRNRVFNRDDQPIELLVRQLDYYRVLESMHIPKLLVAFAVKRSR